MGFRIKVGRPGCLDPRAPGASRASNPHPEDTGHRSPGRCLPVSALKRSDGAMSALQGPRRRRRRVPRWVEKSRRSKTRRESGKRTLHPRGIGQGVPTVERGYGFCWIGCDFWRLDRMGRVFALLCVCVCLFFRATSTSSPSNSVRAAAEDGGCCINPTTHINIFQPASL